MVPGYQRLAGSQNNGSPSYHPGARSSLTWAILGPSWVAPRRSSRSPLSLSPSSSRSFRRDFLGLDAGPKNWVPPMRAKWREKNTKAMRSEPSLLPTLGATWCHNLWLSWLSSPDYITDGFMVIAMFGGTTLRNHFVGHYQEGIHIHL